MRGVQWGILAPMTRAGPIFIVGAPRSGTTLLLESLNRHPALWICNETHFLHFVYGRRRRLGDLEDPARRQRLVAAYLKTKRVRDQEVDCERLAERLVAEATGYPEFFTSLMRFCAEEHGRPRFGEKTPDHARSATTLCDLYPDCALIHLVRDPRDVVASLRHMPWGDRSVLGNLREWEACTLGALACRERPAYLRVHYEDLIRKPEETLARTLAFVGEKFAPEMLSPAVEGSAQRPWFERARGAFDSTRLGQWQEKLAPNDVALIEYVAGSTMELLGYELTGNRPSAGAVLAARVAELTDRARNRIRRLPGMWIYWTRPADLAAEERTLKHLA
jgi:hypothetical protein